MTPTIVKKILLAGTLFFSLTTGCASQHQCVSEKRHYYRHEINEMPHTLCMSKYVEITGNKQFAWLTNDTEARKMLSQCQDAGLSCVVAALEKRLRNFSSAVQGYELAEKYEEAARLKEELAAQANTTGNSQEQLFYLTGARQDYQKAFQQYLEDEKCNTCALRVAEHLKDAELITKTKAGLLQESEKYRDFFYASELSQQLGDLERALWNHEKSDDFFPHAPELALATGNFARAIHHHEQHTLELSEQLKNLEQNNLNETESAFAKKELVQALQEHKKIANILYHRYAREAEEQGNFLLALPYFERLEDWSSAARCAEKSNYYRKALEYYQKSGEIHHVRTARWKARHYISRIAEEGDFKKAAVVAEQIGDQTLASKLLIQAEKASTYLHDE